MLAAAASAGARDLKAAPGPAVEACFPCGSSRGEAVIPYEESRSFKKSGFRSFHKRLNKRFRKLSESAPELEVTRRRLEDVTRETCMSVGPEPPICGTSSNRCS